MSSLAHDTSRPSFARVQLTSTEETQSFKLIDITQGGVLSTPFLTVSLAMEFPIGEGGLVVRAYPPPPDTTAGGWAAYIGAILTWESGIGSLMSAFPVLGALTGRQAVSFVEGAYGLLLVNTLGDDDAPNAFLMTCSSASPNAAVPGGRFIP